MGLNVIRLMVARHTLLLSAPDSSVPPKRYMNGHSHDSTGLVARERELPAYDGTEWAKISIKPIPAKLEGMTLVPFFTFKTSIAWVVTE